MGQLLPATQHSTTQAGQHTRHRPGSTEAAQNSTGVRHSSSMSEPRVHTVSSVDWHRIHNCAKSSTALKLWHYASSASTAGCLGVLSWHNCEQIQAHTAWQENPPSCCCCCHSRCAVRGPVNTASPKGAEGEGACLYQCCCSCHAVAITLASRSSGCCLQASCAPTCMPDE